MSHQVDSPMPDVGSTSSSLGVIMPHVVSPEVTDDKVTAPPVVKTGERMEDKKSSGNGDSNTIGCSIGCGCLTTLVLLFVAYEFIDFHSLIQSLRDGYTSYTSWQLVGFWINVLIGAPFVLLVAIFVLLGVPLALIAAFEGVFKFVHRLRSRIRSLWEKKNHG